MSRCVIISAGPFCDPMYLSGLLMEDDYIVAADGGWQLATRMGVKPSVLVADFDSMTIPCVSEDVKVVTLPTQKDVTDTAQAMKIGYDAGYREFLLLGCTGGRLDHQQAAITVAAEYAQRECDVVLADEKNEIHLLTPGEYAFSVMDGAKVSLFAFGGDVTGLFSDGLAYEITDMTLSPFNALCVSNECVAEEFALLFKSGLLMLYFSKD